MKFAWWTSLKALLLLTVLTGVLYPLFVTGVAQLLLPREANGSLVAEDGAVVGSTLIGQRFREERYFHPRPSSIAYQPLPSGGSNAGPTSRALRDSVISRRERFADENRIRAGDAVPVEMLFASGSGVDPHISPSAALAQIDRVAMARGLGPVGRDRLRLLVEEFAEPPQFGLLGEPRVNVLALNLALDARLGK